MKKIFVMIAFLAGMAVLVVLVARQGVGEVASTVSSFRWGLLWISLYHLAPLALNAAAWWAILPASSRAPFPAILRIRWICESVNNLLPVGQLGGDVVRARLSALAGTPGPQAAASVIADYTAGLLSEVVFAAAGFGLFLLIGGKLERIGGLLLGLGIFALCLLGFFVAQRRGIVGMARIGSSWLKESARVSVLGGAQAVQEALARIYGSRGRFLACCGLRFLGWVAGAGEISLAFAFLGKPLAFLEALMIESLVQASRSAAFFVPGAVGVQESVLLLLGSTAGLDPAAALSLSLVKRVRELALGIPGLLAWQAVEGRRLLRRGKAAGTHSGTRAA
jgi:putative membrane protein